MDTQKIIKLAPYKFQLHWTSDIKKKDSITIDFSSIINYFQLMGDFVLIHWQSRPKGKRRWGLYDSFSDQYHAFDWNQLETNGKPSKYIQSPELPDVLPPCAVVLYENTKVKIEGNKILLK